MKIPHGEALYNIHQVVQTEVLIGLVAFIAGIGAGLALRTLFRRKP